jgi:predicted RNase H-like HicB family nuclease
VRFITGWHAGSAVNSESHPLAAPAEGVDRTTDVGIVGRVGEQLDLTIVYEPSEDGWILASIPRVGGVFSQGRTREEARANVIDALRVMLSPEPDEGGDSRERERVRLTIAA